VGVSDGAWEAYGRSLGRELKVGDEHRGA